MDGDVNTSQEQIGAGLSQSANTTALILPGGGARAAYQVGVIKALGELNPTPQQSPCGILCGTSAGAINAVSLATHANNFGFASNRLEDLWMALEPDKVFRSDWFGVSRNALRLILSLFGDRGASSEAVSLLDNRPLRGYLKEVLNFVDIADHIAEGHLQAISITAMNYSKGASVNFFQGGPTNGAWQRWRRSGEPTPLQLRHLMASIAIPTLFRPQRIAADYYGDGSLRQLTPISPALHLGAERVLIVPCSGHHRSYLRRPARDFPPAFGQIIGHLLNSAFIDSIETDIERLESMNDLARRLTEEQRAAMVKPIKPIDAMVISPSDDIDAIADRYVKHLPASLRFFLRSSGSDQSAGRGGVNVGSYLLFVRPFIEQLIKLGYNDVMAQQREVSRFLWDS